jgi:hypothetical protein
MIRIMSSRSMGYNTCESTFSTSSTTTTKGRRGRCEHRPVRGVEEEEPVLAIGFVGDVLR